MPRYFFNLYNDIVACDDEGMELPDLEAARRHAVVEAREMICRSIRGGHLNMGHRIEIVDGKGDIVLSLAFGDAFTLIMSDEERSPAVRHQGAT